MSQEEGQVQEQENERDQNKEKERAQKSRWKSRQIREKSSQEAWERNGRVRRGPKTN